MKILITMGKYTARTTNTKYQYFWHLTISWIPENSALPLSPSRLTSFWTSRRSQTLSPSLLMYFKCLLTYLSFVIACLSWKGFLSVGKLLSATWHFNKFVSKKAYDNKVIFKDLWQSFPSELTMCRFIDKLRNWIFCVLFL